MSRNDISKAIASSKNPNKKEAKNYGKVEPFVPRPATNTFADDGTEAAQDRVVNNPTLEKLYANAPGTVARGLKGEAVQKIEATCSVCHKTEEVHPLFAPREQGAIYRCNDCCKPQGRKKRRG